MPSPTFCFAALAGLLVGANAFAEPSHSTKFLKEEAAEKDLKDAISGLKAQIRDFGKFNETAGHKSKADLLSKDKALFKGFVHELVDDVSKASKPVEVSFEKPDLEKPEDIKEEIFKIVEAKKNETAHDWEHLKKDLDGPIVVNVTTYDVDGLKDALWSGLKNATSKPGKDVVDMLAAAKDEVISEKDAGEKGEEAAAAKLAAAKDALKARLVGKLANLTKHSHD